jgi:hypothetical protein
MKKLITLFAAFFAATGISFAAVSMSGFVDGSLDDDDNQVAIDEVEVRIALDSEGAVTGVAELSYVENRGGSTAPKDDLDLEQVYLTYALGEGSSLKIGKFESTLGFDGYDADSLIAHSAGLSVVSGYNSGVQYTSGALNIALAEGSVTSTNATPELSSDDYLIEASYSMDLGNGFNVFVGAQMNEANSSELTNAYLTYESGAATYFVEMFRNDNGSAPNTDGTQYGVVYSYSDTASVTARITDANDKDGWTVAHTSQLADDLALVLDLSEGYNATSLKDEQQTTVELLYTF